MFSKKSEKIGANARNFFSPVKKIGANARNFVFPAFIGGERKIKLTVWYCDFIFIKFSMSNNMCNNNIQYEISYYEMCHEVSSCFFRLVRRGARACVCGTSVRACVCESVFSAQLRSQVLYNSS